MSLSKLTVVALISTLVGVAAPACSRDEGAKSEPAPAAAAKPAPTATAPAAAAAAPAAAEAAAKADDGYSCDKGMEEHAESGCTKWDDEAAEVSGQNVPADAVWVAFDVDGMTCGGCERRIQANVGKMDGVFAVEASSELGRVRVAVRNGETDGAAAKTKIAELGYNVK